MHLRRRHLMLGLGALAFPWPALARLEAMHGVDAPEGIDPEGYLVSEKLDGVRALWDGQRLRFRSGHPVPAPEWFTVGLPPVALDGELWLGRGRFDRLSGTVRRIRPDETAWRSLRYMVFDLPGAADPFEARARRLTTVIAATAPPWCQMVAQRRLDSPETLQRTLRDVLQSGGEGLMLHRADAIWRPGRSDALFKLKPYRDAEAVVIGSVPGRGRLQGLMGALKVRRPDGSTFLLGSGFSDAQRRSPPGPGTLLTYRYRGLTSGGLPRFASFERFRSVP